MKAISDMTLDELRDELVWSTRMLEVHRRDGERAWCVQRCDEGFPCNQREKASANIKAVSEALAERKDRIDQAWLRRDW